MNDEKVQVRTLGGGSCPVCGVYQMMGSFCPEHGAPLQDLRCKECDAIVLRHHKFCAGCGSRR